MRRYAAVVMLAAFACGDGGAGPIVGRPGDVPRSTGPEPSGRRLESPGARETPDPSTLTLAEACRQICSAASGCLPVQGCNRDCLESFRTIDDPACAAELVDFGLCLFGACPAAFGDPEDCSTPELVACVEGDD